MSDCSRYQELICALVDEELNNKDRAALMAHIAECPECSIMYSAFAAVSEAVAEDVEEVPEALHENIMAGVRRSAIMKQNSRRNMRHTKSMIAAAACFAVVIMSAIGISGALSERRSSVLTANSEMAMVAEAPIKNLDTAKSENTVPAPTVKPAAETPIQPAAPAVSASPVTTAAPVQTADPYAASETPAPVQATEAPKSEIATQPATVPIEPVSTAVPETAAVPQTAAEVSSSEPVYDVVVEEEAADAPAFASEPVIEPIEDTSVDSTEQFVSARSSSADQSAASAANSAASAKSAESSGRSIFSFFSIPDPAATEAPKAEEQKFTADVTVDFRDKKNFEELAKLLSSKAVETLPEGNADKTYCFIIKNGNMDLNLLVYAYGDKLYYTIYDELIEQPVYAVSGSQAELEKLIDSVTVTPTPAAAAPSAAPEAADSFQSGSTSTEAVNDNKVSVAPSGNGIGIAGSGSGRVTVK